MTVKVNIEKFVLDTSALFSLLKKEQGADRIESILVSASLAEVEASISIVSLIEIYYISVQEQSAELGDERVSILRGFPMTIEHLYDRDVKYIGDLKANYKMSFADCCIAGLTKRLDAVLVHKDPEFDSIASHIKLEALPYKKTTKTS